MTYTVPQSSWFSPWMAEPPEARPPLEGSLSVDAAVIGAGYTGLSAAIALREAGLDVAVLERETAGFGASGRNAGHLTPTVGKDLPTLLRVFGKERGRRLVSLAEEAIGFVERAIERFHIDCEYDATGNVIAAVHRKQQARLERAAEAAGALGARVTFLPFEEMRRRGLPRAFVCGAMEGRGGTLHPGRYVRGLRRAAIESGVRLFEGTPVLSVQEGTRLVLRTPKGQVEAPQLVLGTNAFTPELGWLRNRILRLSVSLFETEPLSPAQLDAVGWRGREGIYTAHESLESYRLTRRGTIVGGSKRVRYGFRGRALPDRDDAIFALIEGVFRDRFPELSQLRIAHFWSGPIAFTLDFLPLLGRGGKHGNVFHGVGYAGHGVALASYAGSILADMMLERPSAGAVLTERFCPPLPPEPLRWLTVHGINQVLAAIDRRVDRAAKRESRATAPVH